MEGLAFRWGYTIENGGAERIGRGCANGVPDVVEFVGGVGKDVCHGGRGVVVEDCVCAE